MKGKHIYLIFKGKYCILNSQGNMWLVKKRKSVPFFFFFFFIIYAITAAYSFVDNVRTVS